MLSNFELYSRHCEYYVVLTLGFVVFTLKNTDFFKLAINLLRPTVSSALPFVDGEPQKSELRISVPFFKPLLCCSESCLSVYLLGRREICTVFIHRVLLQLTTPAHPTPGSSPVAAMAAWVPFPASSTQKMVRILLAP